MSNHGSSEAATSVHEALDASLATLPKLLTTADRCDRCGAGAVVQAILPTGGELLFCGHHAREHANRLDELQAVVHDSRLLVSA